MVIYCFILLKISTFLYKICTRNGRIVFLESKRMTSLLTIRFALISH